METKCRLCGADTAFWAKKPILGRHDVSYFRCAQCGAVQTEPPYWLDEANANASGPDPDACQRCFDLVLLTTGLLDWLRFPPEAPCLEFGAGVGLYGRMMRDRGYDFYAQDKFRTPFYMEQFGVERLEGRKPKLIAAFDVIEQMADPVSELESIFGVGADVVLVTAEPFAGQGPDWRHLRPEDGRRVFFYASDSLQRIARGHAYACSSVGSLHVFLRDAYLQELGNRGINVAEMFETMRNGPKFTSYSFNLLLQHLREPYRWTNRDRDRLLARKRGAVPVGQAAAKDKAAIRRP